jgi:hypothetical protein
VSHERIRVIRTLDLISARFGFQLQGTKSHLLKTRPAVLPKRPPPDCGDCQALTGSFRAFLLAADSGLRLDAFLPRDQRCDLS